MTDEVRRLMPYVHGVTVMSDQTLDRMAAERAEWQDARALIALALDALGLALANHGHQWTDGERDLYERAIQACQT
jgi:hypothetical protein